MWLRADKVFARKNGGSALSTALMFVATIEIVPIVLPLIAGLLIGNAVLVNLLWDDYRTEFWPETRGTIQSTSITEKIVDDDGDKVTIYEINVSYEYHVGGQQFRGDRYQLNGFRNEDRAKAQQIIDSLPAGKRVSVHYDPDDPQQSLLVNRLRPFHYIAPLMLIPWDVGLIALIIWLGRIIRRERAGPPIHGVTILEKNGILRAVVSEQNSFVASLSWVALLPIGIVISISILGWPLSWFDRNTDEVILRLLQSGCVFYIVFSLFKIFQNRNAIRMGVRDVLIDPERRKIQLPKRSGQTLEWVAFESILSILIAAKTTDQESLTLIHDVIVGYQQNDDRCELRVASDFYVIDDAKAFRNWLTLQTSRL